jgi:excisionase family DNA binding protein
MAKNGDARKAPAPQPIAYTVPGAAAATGIGRSQLFELMKAGKLAYSRVGGRRQILADDLRQLLERNRVGGDR